MYTQYLLQTSLKSLGKTSYKLLNRAPMNLCSRSEGADNSTLQGRPVPCVKKAIEDWMETSMSQIGLAGPIKVLCEYIQLSREKTTRPDSTPVGLCAVCDCSWTESGELKQILSGFANAVQQCCTHSDDNS